MWILCWLNYYQQAFRVGQKWSSCLNGCYLYVHFFFSIPPSPCLTLLSVTAKSSAEFDPNEVLFDDKCKWLTLKLGFWLKFSKAIRCVLDSPICCGRIADILGARFYICIQNGVRCMQKNLTVCDLKKNSGQSLIHCKVHTDRARSEKSVLSLDTMIWICCLKMNSINSCQQKEGWSSTQVSKQTMCL